MKLRDIYNEVRLLIEKNRTNNNLYLTEDRFVLYFNFLKDKIQNYFLDKRSDDAIRLMAPFLIINKKLTEKSSQDLFSTYQLPEDYFDFSNMLIYAKKNKCTPQQMLAHEIKSENIHQYLSDVNLKPSFLYRETFYLLNSEGITVFTDNDFKIHSLNFSYYKKIKEVDLSGYIHMDGTPSTDIDTDITDSLVPVFVNSIVKYFTASQGDVTNYQIATQDLMSAI